MTLSQYPASFFQFVIEVSSITVLEDLMPVFKRRKGKQMEAASKAKSLILFQDRDCLDSCVVVFLSNHLAH